ncbi:MAG: hypothetical protein U0271_17165 [Polyangiaceae bacterium]
MDPRTWRVLALALAAQAMGCSGGGGQQANDGRQTSSASASSSSGPGTASASSSASARPATSVAAGSATSPPPRCEVEPRDLAASPGFDGLAGASGLLAKGSAKQAVAELQKHLKTRPPWAEAIVAEALLGRACVGAKDTKCAEDAYKVVLKMYEPSRLQQELGGLEDAPREAIIKRLMLAVGEAQFFFADRKVASAVSDAPPVLKKSSSTAEVSEFVRTRFADWLKKHRTAAQEADAELQKVTSAQPAPAPEWVVRAAERAGMLWAAHVDAVRTAPVPAEWQGTGKLPGTDISREEIRAQYQDALDSALEPDRQRAEGAYKFCVSLAEKMCLPGMPEAQRCLQWVEQHPSKTSTP